MIDGVGDFSWTVESVSTLISSDRSGGWGNLPAYGPHVWACERNQQEGLNQPEMPDKRHWMGTPGRVYPPVSGLLQLLLCHF